MFATAQQQPPPIHPGMRLGAMEELEVVRLLGRGGWSEVYLVQDHTEAALGIAETARPVAMKVLLSALEANDELLRRFQQEAEIGQRVADPRLLEIYDVRYSEKIGAYYLLMPFVDGIDLGKVITAKQKQERRFTFAEALPIIREVCLALQSLHTHDIIHRDVKPANVLLGRDGSVYLTDYGISKVVRPSPFNCGTTISGVIIGSAPYMAPEQWVGGPMDRRTDVFSLGVVMYEMLVGEHPWPEMSFMEWLQSGHSLPPVSPREVVSEFPGWMERILLKSLSKAAAGRYRTTRELWEAIRTRRP